MLPSSMGFREWVAVGLFGLTVGLFAMMGLDPALAKEPFFENMAEAIIVTGLINGAVTFAYGTNKSSADKDATIKGQLKGPNDGQ